MRTCYRELWRHFGTSAHNSQVSLQLTASNSPPGGQPTVSTLSAPPAPLSLHSSLSVKEPYVLSPAPFSGEICHASGFLLRCSLVFDLQPSSHPSDEAKIACVINLLQGKAARWATSVWEQGSPA